MNRTISLIILIIIGLCNAAFAAPPQRIISLAPSTTEVLFALGLGDRVVGVTTFCDYPAEAKAKPKIGGMSNPSLEAIVSLKPDLVVMTMDGNPREIEDRLRSLKISTHVFTSRTLAELPQGIRAIGAATGAVIRGESLAKEMESALAAVRLRAHDSVRKHASPLKRKVLFIVWPEPLIVAGPGTAIGDAIDLLGLENTAANANTTYPRYSIEEVIRQAPDVLFIGKGSGMNMHAVAKGILKKISTVPAVKNNNVCYVGDGLYRLGPRVVQGIEELAACLK